MEDLLPDVGGAELIFHDPATLLYQSNLVVILAVVPAGLPMKLKKNHSAHNFRGSLFGEFTTRQQHYAHTLHETIACELIRRTKDE